MTVFEKLKLQEAYQKVLNESWGDIINAGYSSMAMGSPLAPRPYRPGTDELKSAKELHQEQKNSVIGTAAGLAAGAAVVNPAAAATVGKYALQGLNAYSNYELLNDLSNDLPTATTAAGAMAILKPQKAASIAQKVLNSRWGWIPGVAYPVTRAFVDGYYNGDDSQPLSPSVVQQPQLSADQPMSSNTNQQQTPNQQSSATDDCEATLAKYDSMVRRADAQGFPISTVGTNNVVDKVGVEWLKSPDYKERFTDLWNVVNGKITRDMEKDSNSGK